MISPEKNDVDISKLFNWNTKCIILGVDGISTIEVYIKLVGDADWNIARVKSLRASAELRRKLNDPESDEHLAYIPIKDDVEKEGLIHMMLVLEMSDFRQQVIKDFSMPFPKEPGQDAELEDLEEHQKEVDNYEEKRQEVIKEELEKLLERKKKQYSKVSFDNLYKDYVKTLINALCKEELNRVFLSYTTYVGTYKDENFTERYFKSYEEFDNLPTVIKNQLLGEYADLDIKIYDLKK